MARRFQFDPGPGLTFEIGIGGSCEQKEDTSRVSNIASGELYSRIHRRCFSQHLLGTINAEMHWKRLCRCTTIQLETTW